MQILVIKNFKMPVLSSLASRWEQVRREVACFPKGAYPGLAFHFSLSLTRHLRPRPEAVRAGNLPAGTELFIFDLMKKVSLLIALFCGLFTTVSGQQIDKTLPEFSISELEVAGQMHFLASDFLQGRRTGSNGNVIAANYIASQLRAFGYTPINGESYFQTVPLVQRTAPTTGKLTAGDYSFTQGNDLLLVKGPAAEISTGVVFANYGWVDEESNHNDYADLNVKGKIVITRPGIPGDAGQRGIFRGIREKAQMAADAGAAGIVELYLLPFPWQNFKAYFGGASVGLDEGNDTPIPYGFVKAGDDFLPALKAKKKGLKGSLSSNGQQRSPLESMNVGGVLEGTDPELKEEYMLMTAHFDHVGVGKQGGGPFTPQDSIFNGARDNAFGTISLLQAAKAFAAKPPRRSIIVLAVTGEEMGLLGSKYYAENPLVPLEKTVFNFNTDGAGYDDIESVSLIGANRTGIDPQVAIAAETFGKGVINDPAPEQGLYDRSDNVSFSAKGVPSLTFSGGTTGFSDEIMKYYHQAGDNPETINMTYLKEYCQAYTLAARLIANRDVRPYWVKGDKYEEMGDKLYNK